MGQNTVELQVKYPTCFEHTIYGIVRSATIHVAPVESAHQCAVSHRKVKMSNKDKTYTDTVRENPIGNVITKLALQESVGLLI